MTASPGRCAGRCLRSNRVVCAELRRGRSDSGWRSDLAPTPM